MIRVHILSLGFASLSIVTLPTCAQENTPCVTPDKTKSSTCIGLYRCDSFVAILRMSAGKPSAADQTYILSHGCGQNRVCCPDNAVPIVTTTTSTTTAKPISPPELIMGVKVATSPVIPPLSNLDQVNSHRNIKLINIKCGSASSDRIIGGKIAAVGEFPWMALLRFKARLDGTLSFNCGGTLIANQYVLTAAHCVNRDLYSVRLGEHTISTVQDCDANGKCLDPVQDILIEKAIRHDKYDNQRKINDIALLRLATPADTTKRGVKTICLPTTADNQLDALGEDVKDSMLISGWGRVENGQTSDVLLKAFVPFLSTDRCAQRFAAEKVPVYSSYLCAGGANKTDTCHGDSGGPIQTVGPVNDRPKMVLYGVVSVGVECLNPDALYPGIYTNVAHYLTWILDNMS